MDSIELSALANTVPSDSEHEFLVEAVESYFHHQIAKAQLMKHDTMRKLRRMIERKEKRGGDNVTYIILAIERKITDLMAETEWNMKRITLDRDEALKALNRWESKH